MNFNLQMLNLWIGLCKGVPGLPNSLRELGYRLHSIERTIRNEDGKECKAELILYSEKQGHSLLLEWKSGPNLTEDQLGRYSRLSSKCLVDFGLIPKRAAKAFDVAVVGKAEHEERLKLGLANGKHSFPLLLMSDGGLKLACNKFSSDRLTWLFNATLSIDWEVAPTSFVPISEESHSWEVAEIVIPKVLERMTQRATVIKASSLCPDLCPQWDVMAKSAQVLFKKSVCNVLRQAAEAEFLTFLVWSPLQHGDCQVDCVHNPIEDHGSKRNGAYRRLKNASVEFRARLSSGREFRFDPGLFDNVDAKGALIPQSDAEQSSPDV